MKCLCAVFFVVCFAALLASQAKAEDASIHAGSKVTFSYTLTVDGKVFDTSEGKAPLEYTQGDNKMIPGLAKQMEGLKTGDERNIEVKPEDAYGMPDPKAFKDVPLTQLPKGMKPEVGMLLQAAGSKDGMGMPVRIAEVKKDSVVIDFNHPLAGKMLKFHIKVISVK